MANNELNERMNHEIAKRLSEAMNSRGMSAADLSRASGIGQSDISNYLNAKYRPKQAKVARLAEALNVDPAWLWALDVLDSRIQQGRPHSFPPPAATQSPPPRIAVLTRGWNNLSDEQQAMLLRAAEAMFPVAFGKEIDDD